MNLPLLVITHLSAAGLGLLVSLLFKTVPHATAIEREKEMANEFVSLLDHIGDGLKKFFTSPVAADVEDFGISIAEAAWPGLTPFLTSLQASIAKAQALAQAANVSGDTTAQVVALALSDAQQAFTTYEQASGTTLETSQQQAIIQLVINLLASLPAPTNTTIAATPQASVSTSVAPVQPGAAVAAATQNGPGLAAVVPQ